ncbi:MAG: hypothetical protein KatS3mg115_1959 [Candidatus Poribacteria bacterium]|nr:MAG: hypothetical protein KatS3mg115_1959 [Candidatus Poribacteria bacterium]
MLAELKRLGFRTYGVCAFFPDADLPETLRPLLWLPEVIQRTGKTAHNWFALREDHPQAQELIELLSLYERYGTTRYLNAEEFSRYLVRVYQESQRVRSQLATRGNTS